MICEVCRMAWLALSTECVCTIWPAHWYSFVIHILETNCCAFCSWRGFSPCAAHVWLHWQFPPSDVPENGCLPGAQAARSSAAPASIRVLKVKSAFCQMQLCDERSRDGGDVWSMFPVGEWKPLGSSHFFGQVVASCHSSRKVHLAFFFCSQAKSVKTARWKPEESNGNTRVHWGMCWLSHQLRFLYVLSG